MSESTIIKALALLTLPCTVQDRVEAGELAPSVAYEVSKLDDPHAQAEVAARVVAEGLSRAETVEAVKRAAGRPRAGGARDRGAGKGAPKLPTERTVKTAGGLKVTVAGRKGFDVPTWIGSLRDALDQATARLEPAQAQGGEPGRRAG
jgi:ParB family chromosome partitioning protein